MEFLSLQGRNPNVKSIWNLSRKHAVCMYNYYYFDYESREGIILVLVLKRM